MVATLGGTGTLHGVVLGAVGVRRACGTQLSNLSPRYWQLGLGLVLMASVLVLRGGIAGGLARLRRRRGAVTAPALQTRGLEVRFGSFTAVGGVDLSVAPGARHALIGPNGAGKTTLRPLR